MVAVATGKERYMSDAERDCTRVLVIDDNVVTRRLLQLHLTSLGYESIISEDGESGLSAAELDVPDAVLLDIQLPGMDGLEVCRRLRANARTASIPILILTSMTDAGTRVAGFEAGADDYVTKPFEARELAARLRAHMTLAQQRGRIAAMEGVCCTLRMLAHEFNNPLQTVVGGLHICSSAAAASAEHEEGVRMAQEGVERLTELAHQLHNLVEPVFKATPMGTMLDVEASSRQDPGGR